jgi:hypothetical protein
MRYALVLLFILPLHLNAQGPALLSRPMAPAEGMRSMRITTTFYGEHKGKSFTDTAFNERAVYNENGTLASKTYASVLDKSTYTSGENYTYGIECWWSRKVYENNRLVDSATLFDCGSVGGSRFIFGPNGLHEIYEYRGDSVFNTIVDASDTIRRAWRELRTVRDPEWDYAHAGTFSRKHTSGKNDIDTVWYYDKSDKCIFRIVHHFDAGNRPVKTEYFNDGVKKFVVLSMRYNERLSVSEYVVRSKKGMPSYTIEREYNEKGLLKKEIYRWRRKGRFPIVKDYRYEFY